MSTTWKYWVNTLPDLKAVRICRTYSEKGFTQHPSSVHIFSDASEQAIAAVAYLLTFESDTPQIGFLLGKSKVAPIAGHTIPRLELCAAVMAVEIAQTVAEHLGISIETFTFHTDSRVVLGYINNNTRRFHTYVSNRVEQIRRSTKPAQWRYVCTKLNPSDCATRGLAASDLLNSAWLQGPTHLTSENSVDSETYHLFEPEHDKELRVDVNVSKSAIKSRLGSERFSRFSEWRRLVQAIAYLQHFVEKDQAKSQRKEVPSYQKAEKFIIKVVQAESYLKELDCFKLGKPVSKQSHILQLDPYLDEDGLLRVGGRLSRSSLSTCEKNPIIIPGDHHISVLLIRHYHESVQHKGRHFTAGAVRKAGFWNTGGSGRVSSFIFKCVKCRKLRGNLQTQKMAELPSCRLSEALPFTYVGVDTFGPWQVSTRRTRGGQASSKRWAVLFTCMTVRAIHIEVVKELSSSAFINALRRFVSIRGKVNEFFSDRGTNFVGAVDELNMKAIQVEQGDVKRFLYDNGVVWKFNTPHSSHMGGAWERMIGVVRRILDSMLSDVKNLTHDVIVILMAEACAIVNSRPLVPVSNDSDVPEVLSPSTILTSKTGTDEQPLGQMDVKDMLRSQWKRVKHLADTFWCRWRKEYLQTLQPRRKWNHDEDNIRVGDIVLLRDKSVSRIYWPIARVNKVFPSSDEKVRKEVLVYKDDKLVSYVRPIVEMVLLVNAE
ncbi:uncharacterized protein LOC128242202 [Mya arenaria]|uniref:uncharacterized protein LOC128242202 n=1 Tax=Mya arenaria TaxID=6604 RepID=UPI0022E5C43D|nr:uncharacterized protein LOC128242202 [Mya arenaria]